MYYQIFHFSDKLLQNKIQSEYILDYYAFTTARIHNTFSKEKYLNFLASKNLDSRKKVDSRPFYNDQFNSRQ